MTRPSLPPLSRGSSQIPSDRAALAIRTFEGNGGDLGRPEVTAALAALADHAPGLVGRAVADPALLPDVLARPLHRGDDEASIGNRFFAATSHLEDGPELYRELRRQVHRGMVRIALREIERLADVDATSREMAALASAAIDASYRAARRTVEAATGAIVDERGAPVPFAVLGMGKLGGGELNLGSDIDLVFLYGTDEGRAGSISIHEAFRRVAQRLSKALADNTEDGFCFRVDHRLRPEGSAGPLANSLASAERYYEAFGRPWERAALLRARPVAGERAVGEEFLEALSGFVYPRSVDRRIVGEMRAMVERSRRELAKQPDRDIKLCRGGIREAEFFVQTLQLLFGGQSPELRSPSTTRALRALRTSGHLGHREAMQLGADWALLRRVEHRIHVFTGFQTHLVPAAGPELERFARSLGFEDGTAFAAELDATRKRVAALFDSLEGDLPQSDDSVSDELVLALLRGDERVPALARDALPSTDPDEALTHLRRLAKNPHSPFGASGQARQPTLAAKLLREVDRTAYPDAALRHLAEFFTRVGADYGYDRVLAEDPRFTRRLVSLFGASATLSSHLIGHPESLESLLLHQGLPSASELVAAHEDEALAHADLDDEEAFVLALRRRQRELTLRVGLAYVSSECTLSEACDRMTSLAELQMGCALDFAIRAQARKHGEPRAESGEPSTLAVIGMGKFGGRELGFGSDLDVIFLYSHEGQSALGNGDHFARVVQRALRLLTQPNEEGRGYDLDTRLRPNGNRGPLVQSFESFVAYHAERSDGWERQALTRARVVYGEPAFAAKIESACERAAYERPAPEPSAVCAMRYRIERELGQERAGRYHVKYGRGGLVDVEFLVQILAMRHGSDPRVRVKSTAAAIQVLEATGRLDADDAEGLRDALSFAREIEQTSKLLDSHRDAVLVADGPIAERIARRLRIRDRDGIRASEVLLRTWERTAGEVRAIFEELVGPVVPAPATPG